MAMISIIVPVYNVERYLKQCLESILAQTYKDIEVICVNDGSTDNSGQILAEYAKKDARIKVLEQENRGAAAARNLGLEASVASYIAFIDGDDVVSPDYISILMDNMECSGADVSCCDFQKKGADKFKSATKRVVNVSDNPLKELLRGRGSIYFNVWNKLYKREVIGGLRFEDRNQYEDWIFSSLLFTKVRKICWINAALYYYRIREESTMRSPFNMNKLDSYVIGIRVVYDFYKKNCPEFLEGIKKVRISQTLKMLVKKAANSGNQQLIAKSKEEVKKLYGQGLVGYSGLSIKGKFMLWKFMKL